MTAFSLAAGLLPLPRIGSGRLRVRLDEHTPPSDPDARCLERLRAGDEAAFMELVERHHAALVRLARSFVSSRAVAEDVAQETWLGVLNGLDRFEGRSSLKTWIFRILVNRAKTRGERESRSVPFSSLETGDGEPAVDPDRFEGRSSLKTWLFRILTNRAKTRAVREARSVPFSSLAGPELGSDEPSVDADRFLPADHARWPGHWASAPRSWAEIPEQRLLGAETRQVISDAIDALPTVQRTVISLRDVEGWGSEEVCEALDLTEGNQRVLLHRARSKVRAALEAYLEEVEPAAA